MSAFPVPMFSGRGVPQTVDVVVHVPFVPSPSAPLRCCAPPSTLRRSSGVSALVRAVAQARGLSRGSRGRC